MPPTVGIKVAIDNCPQGARFVEGWVFIANVNGNAQSGINFDVAFYASEVSFNNGYLPLCSKQMWIPYQPGDLVQLLHAHLLTVNLDDSAETNKHARIKCNLTEGQMIVRPDPIMPTGDASQE